jgi:regulator of replication initiation timing
LKQLDSFAEDLEKIDSTFTGAANSQLAYYHTSEVDSSNFFAVLKQTLKVYISPEYATKDAQIASLKKQVDPEKAKNKQLSEDNAQLEERLSVATEKGKRNDSEIASLRSDKQKLEEENKSLRNENSSLKSELERNKAKNSVERSLSQIKQPLEDLLKGVRKLVPSSTFEEHHHHVYRAYEEEQRSSRRDLRSIIIDAIIVATFILMIGLCGFVIYKSVLSQPEYKVKEPKKEQTTNIPAPKVPKPTICVNGLEDGGEIEREKEYLVTLLNYPNGKQIKWKLDGVDTPNSRSEAQIKVKTVAGSDKVTISCYVIEDTGENLIDKKQWIIKK